MSSWWFIRSSPNGQHAAGGHERIQEDGVDLGPGSGPRYAGDDVILFGRQPDGALMRWTRGHGAAVVVRSQGFNFFDVAPDLRWMGYRADPPRVIWWNGVEWPGWADGDISLTRWAARQHHNSALWAGTANGEHGILVDGRACSDVRLLDDVLVWTVAGQIYAQRHHGARVENWSIPGLYHYWPFPIRIGGKLYLGTHTEDRLLCYEAKEGQTHGHLVATGITDSPDGVGLDERHIRFLWSARGEKGERILDVTQPEVDLREDANVAPLNRPAFIGGFYATTDRYPEAVTDYPQNCEVIVEASAIARATTPVIVSPDALAGVSHAQRVIGLYVAAEEEGRNTASHLDIAAELARAAWRERFPSHPVPAVVGYVTRGMTARPTWPPRAVDVFAPECYFDLQSTPSAAGLEALVAGWTHVLSASRPWLLTAQGYDRNGVMRDRMDALASTAPAYLEALRARPWILGLLWFAVNRPGGVRDYPALLDAHRRIFAAVPSAPVTLPVAVPPPDPDEDDMNRPGVTIDSYGPVIGPTGTWSVEFHDRNNEGVSGKVEIVDGSVHVTLANPEGTDRSGNRRPVEIRS